MLNVTMSEAEYITTNEAAKILGVTRWHISHLARGNKLKYKWHTDPYYGGKSVMLIHKQSLLEYQENKSNRGRPGKPTP